MKLHVKNIIVMKKVDTGEGGSKYERIVIPINQVMTKADLKQMQKEKAAEYGVMQNMVGGNIDEIE